MATQLENSVNRFIENEQRVETFVHGGITSTYVARDGRQVPSLSKFLNDQAEKGMFKPYLTQDELLNTVPQTAPTVATALDTNKVFFWDGSTWTDTGKSQVEQAEFITSRKIGALVSAIAGQAVETLTEQDFNIPEYLSAGGVGVESYGNRATDYVPVKKGECYLVVAPFRYATNHIYAYMYDTNKAPSSPIGYRNIDAYQLDTQEFSTLTEFYKKWVGFDERVGNSHIIPIRAPKDGYLRFVKPLDPYNSGLAFGEFTVLKVPFKLFCDSTLSILPSAVLAKFKDVLYSAERDYVTRNGEFTVSPTLHGYGGNIVGEPTNIVFDSYQGFISKPIPVKEGQYIHFTASSFVSRSTLIYEDASGNYLGEVVPLGEYSLASFGHLTTMVAGLNIKSRFTGRIRLASDGMIPNFESIGVTDHVVDYPKKYLKTGMRLLETKFSEQGFEGIINPHTDDFRPTPYAEKSFISYRLGTDGQFTQNLEPMVLERNKVLVFTAKAFSPLLASIYPMGTDLNNGMVYRLWNSGMITKQDQLDRLIVDPVAGVAGWDPQGWWASKPVTVFYHNPDEDVLVRLMTSNVVNPEYDIKVLTVEEYKEFRKEYLKTLQSQAGYHSKFTGTPYVNWRATQPVLVFKGEVVSFPTTNYVTPFLTLKFADNAYGSPVHWDSNPSMETPMSGMDALECKPVLDGEVYKLGEGITYMTQVATENCLVVSNNILMTRFFDQQFEKTRTLDLDLVLRHYPVQVSDRSDFSLESVPLAGLNRRSFPWLVTDNHMGFYHSYDYVGYAIPMIKGRCYRFESFGHTWNAGGTLVVWSVEERKFITPHRTTFEGPLVSPTIFHPRCFYYKAESDGIAFISSYTGKDMMGNIPAETGPDELRLISQWGGHFKAEEITIDRYREEAVCTPKNQIVIPRTHGLRLGIVGLLPSDLTKTLGTKAQVQFILGDRVIAVVNTRLSINGNGSKTTWKPNLKLEFFAENWEDEVEVQVGPWKAVTSLILKGFNTEKSNIRESSCMVMYRKMRKTDVYPDNQLIDIETVRSQSVDNFYGPVLATTDGFPVPVYMGGVFYANYTLRSRAKRADYAMKKSNKNHIQLAMDWWLNGDADWANFNLNQWEVTNPSIKNYEPGDSTLPSDFASVETAIRRFFTWAKDVREGRVTMADTYKDYINLNNWLDFIIFSEAIGNWDGQFNNTSIVTWDAKHWYVYPYDLDGSLGYGINGAYQSEYASVTNRAIFELFYADPVIHNKLKQRYAQLREAGVLNTSTWMDIINDLNGYTSTTLREADIALWGTNDYNSFNFIMSWIDLKTKVLDDKYTYLPQGRVYQGLWDPARVPAGQTVNTTFNVSGIAVGTPLKVSFASNLQGTTMTAEVLATGVITVKHTNPTSAEVNLSQAIVQISLA